jgi:hypothetical protein
LILLCLRLLLIASVAFWRGRFWCEPSAAALQLSVAASD